VQNPESKRFKIRLRPRRVPRESRAPSASRLRAISARLRRRRGVRRRPPPRVPFLGFSPSVLQQSIVKVRYVQNRGGSGWRVHGRFHEKASRVNYKFIPNFLLAALADSDFAARLGSPTRLPFALVEGPLPGAGA